VGAAGVVQLPTTFLYEWHTRIRWAGEGEGDTDTTVSAHELLLALVGPMVFPAGPAVAPWHCLGMHGCILISVHTVGAFEGMVPAVVASSTDHGSHHLGHHGPPEGRRRVVGVFLEVR
jgi:hypothetical protein